MRFLSDAVEDKWFTVACQMHCLRQKFGVTDNLFWEYDFRTEDVDTIPAKDFIAGPQHGIYKDGGKSEFPAYVSKIRPLEKRERKKCIIYSFQIRFKIETIKL